MRIVAIDPSLRSTGYATPEGVGLLRPPKDAAEGPARLAWIRNAVLELVADADLVLLEGYAWFAEGRAAVSLGELGGVLRLMLHEIGVPYIEIDPNRLKKYATGAGNAKKEAVLVAAVRRFGYTGSSNDEADALVLRKMALDWYELPGAAQVPAAQRAVLESIEWPLPKTPAVQELAL